MPIPQRLQPGKRLADDDALNTALATPQWQTNYGITALAGARAAATPKLSLGSNVVSTSTNTGTDGVVLPSAVAGSVVHLLNASAYTITVFGNASDTIIESSLTPTAGATGVTYATAKRVMFVCITNGVWVTNVMAAT